MQRRIARGVVIMGTYTKCVIEYVAVWRSSFPLESCELGWSPAEPIQAGTTAMSKE